MAVQQPWCKRELERQIRLAAFEKVVLAPPKLSPAVREIHGESAVAVFKDAYALEFLELPTSHAEADLHRGLNCLVAIELQVDRFEPEQPGQAELLSGSAGP